MKIYDYNKNEFTADILKYISKSKQYSKRKIKYYNIPVSFDIETTSFYEGKEKRATMYIWMLAISQDVVIMGRTWSEYLDMIQLLVKTLNLNDNNHLIIWVHNLAYEFQFIRKIHKWNKIFAISERKPIQAIDIHGIEFRCSYMLSGESLEHVAEKLHNNELKKMTGDLDYTLIRNSQTKLTAEEKQYCINDVLIVTAYIQEKIDEAGKITKLPLTKTGYVRNYCRSECLSKNTGNWYRYRRIMNQLQLEPDEYKQLQRAFQGGFTHANARQSCRIINNVDSLDFTSSYPAVMVLEKFPMSRAFKIDNISKNDFYYYNKHYCTMFDITFNDLEETVGYDHPLSYSRCRNISNAVSDNGRIARADSITTTLTDLDFKVISKFYTWSDFSVANFRYYYKGYLPKAFVLSVLQIYKDKTVLKGINGKEHDYRLSKEMLNSCYGMTVTNIIRDDIQYSNDEWSSVKPDNIEDKIKYYNESKKRFLFYPWGVWITAYARYNLFEGILACGKDYIYSDTDSIKLTNYSAHKQYFDDYNEMITRKIHAAAEHHNIPDTLFMPETASGTVKKIGAWDYEGHYSRFKTLGAKRYMTDTNGVYDLTVSGINKEKSLPYLSSTYPDPMKAFNNDLNIPKGYTGKNIHTYIDEPHEGKLTDYTGITADYYDLSSVHMEASNYSLSLTQAYINFILNIKDETI